MLLFPPYPVLVPFVSVRSSLLNLPLTLWKPKNYACVALLAFGPLCCLMSATMEDEHHGVPFSWPEDASYTASYCEENVYLLGARRMAMTRGVIYVVFISNSSKTVSSAIDIPCSTFLTAPRVHAFGHTRSFYLSPEPLRSIQSREDSQLSGIIT